MAERWHHILAHPDAIFPPRELARAMAGGVRRTVLDETQRLRNCGGWIWRDEPEEEVADAVEAACREVGVRMFRCETVSPIQLCPVTPVEAAALDGQGLRLRWRRGELEAPVESALALMIGVTGQPRGRLGPREEQVHRQVESMLSGLSFHHLRAALHGSGLTRPRPQLYLGLPGQVGLLRLERDTRFEGPSGETADDGTDGGASAIGLDRWFAFVDRLLAAVPEDRILPGVREFWREGELDAVLWDPPEHREPRLSWLHHWLELRGFLRPLEQEVDPEGA